MSDTVSTAAAAPDCAALVPLQLSLQPNGLALVVTRPEVVVGRHSSCDVRLPLPDVSRRHCRLEYAEGIWKVFDLQSLNGVFVNGQRIGQSDLNDGDLLRLGGFVFAVQFLPPQAATPADEPPAILRRTPIPTHDSERRRAS
jgi:pSer/pThr/pTyr-binding forkhead associated (FHA) protein